ncbi:hypothetical protein Sya03_48350 [Spirilliplanes yamanashiensis]|uniref:Uncharacterized protein n=1 Tax=Spirilliplanes yamanashiensis TaxID=42233 RepID=A0A8J3YD25_9ACTN|nr:hypothetical protein Sya03_48350 [Spirilliplanes yamanashiensis]
MLAAALAGGLALAGCSGDDPAPAPTGPPVEVATVRGSLLQATDIGATWRAPEEPPPANQLVSFCGGDTTGPVVPPGPQVVAAPLVDEGTKGAQTLHQTGLVYPDAAAAAAGLASLRAVADACPPTVTMPARDDAQRREPAYTETVRTTPLDEGGWTGFVVIRHKTYDPAHPSTADTAVAVLTRRNVVIVDAYAVYRLGAASTSPQFDTDWKRLVGTVLNRLGA